MTEREISDRLKNIMHDVFGKQDFDFDSNTNLRDAGLNSFGLIQVICRVEEEFGIEVPNQKIRNIKSFRSAVRLISRQLRKKAREEKKYK